MKKEICVAAFGEWLETGGNNELGEKWILLLPIIRSKGYELLPIHKHRPGVPVLVFDATKNILQDLKLKHIPREDCILVRVEPRAVNPLQYQKSIRKFFKRTFCPTESQKTLQLDEIWQSGYLKRSQTIDQNAASTLGSRAFEFGLINQNKYSCINGELYDLRRKTIRAFDLEKLKLVVAGKDWQPRRAWVAIRYLHAALIAVSAMSWPVIHLQRSLRNVSVVKFLGRVDSESAFLAQCEVAVVIENETTYSSEKLLNALLAGCRIVYVGSRLDLTKFPKNQILQVDARPDAIIRGAKLMRHSAFNQRHYQLWLKEGVYLKSVEVESNFKALLDQLLT
jgi:hypothetical protein